MSESATALICQVLSGTGGVGKTQLAAHYARQKWANQDLDLLVWVTAGNRDSIVSAYARAGRQVAGTDNNDPVEAAGDFRTWLETTNRRWLIVLDDLADPGDLSGLWPPQSSNGRTIVTTRRRDAALFGNGRRLVSVGLFTLKEATSYLTATLAAHNRRDSPDQIGALAKDLGLLPLALSQAAAYLIDRRLKCVEYRRRFADRRRTLAELLPEKGALPDEQRATVAATWSLSVELADQLAPRGLARPMLQLACMLDANGIPITVLTSRCVSNYLASHRTPFAASTRVEGRFGPTGVSEDSAREALYCLHRLNLADFADNADDNEVRVHALIQRATRDQLTANEFDEAVSTAAKALLEAWVSDQTMTEDAILRANAEALSVRAGSRLWALGAHAVLFETGRSLNRQQLTVAARNYWHQLRLSAEDKLGPDHPDAFYARNYVAGLQARAGDRAGAIAALEELLADRQRVQGLDHPDTLATAKLIANWKAADGDQAGAVAALEELLADQQRIQGPDHPSTLATRATLADWQWATGDRAKAIAGTEALLADRLRIQGPDHPKTLATRATLVHRRQLIGDGDKAIAEMEALLADRLRIQDPDHPKTLNIRAILAKWQAKPPAPSAHNGAQGKSQEALSSEDTAPANGYILKWRAADGTSQSMGPFPDEQTVGEVVRWIRSGKGTEIEVVG